MHSQVNLPVDHNIITITLLAYVVPLFAVGRSGKLCCINKIITELGSLFNKVNYLHWSVWSPVLGFNQLLQFVDFFYLGRCQGNPFQLETGTK